MNKENKTQSIKKEDIQSIAIVHPVCPRCNQTEETNRFCMVDFGGEDWSSSGIMECLDCKQKFIFGTNEPVVEV